ncbi:MAG: LacI family DNA-binding transcriptional regulator [Selenomonadaceae bacterium]
MKINLKKISEISGFSSATVSNALNNKKGVNRETADQILKIARQYGYITEDKIKSIKLVTYRDSGRVFSDSPFFSILMESVENEGRKSGYETTIFNLYRQKPDYEERLQALFSDTTAAILLVGTELSETDARVFQDASVPLVLLDCWFENLSFNAVLMNNADSVFQAVNYLIGRGHRQIGYLKGGVRIQNFKYRAEGYERALKMKGIPVEKKFIFEVSPAIDGAFEDLDQMLQSGREMPTAFFADNDMIALGAMKALQKNGYRIPEDISIIGFDDIAFCSVFTPALTTVRVFKKELGQLAVRHLVKLIKKKSEIKVRMQICNELVERGSVASIKADKTEVK